MMFDCVVNFEWRVTGSVVRDKRENGILLMHQVFAKNGDKPSFFKNE
jgi:hypothetical protein